MAINLGRLGSSKTALLVCDIQEKFSSSIYKFDEIVVNTKRLVDASRLLEMPIICTEQYPKGLGHTVDTLGLKDHPATFSKTSFTMAVPEVMHFLQTSHPQVTAVLLCGVETHVCVLATVMDFIQKGFDVDVVVDCCSSRTVLDRMYALDRIKGMGGFLTTTETVILGLAGGSTHPQFKSLQKLILQPGPDTGLTTHLKSSL